MDNLAEQFGLVYDQYIEKIYRFVLLKVSSQEIAEDITSKVFLKGWEAYKKEQGKIDNPKAFLYRIAGNAVIDHYRAKGRNNVVPADSVAELPATGPTAYQAAILNADMEAVKKALGALKQEYQDIIIWHYIEDLSIAEIAKMISKEEGNVRVILHRALSALREECNKLEGPAS